MTATMGKWAKRLVAVAVWCVVSLAVDSLAAADCFDAIAGEDE